MRAGEMMLICEAAVCLCRHLIIIGRRATWKMVGVLTPDTGFRQFRKACMLLLHALMSDQISNPSNYWKWVHLRSQKGCGVISVILVRQLAGPITKLKYDKRFQSSAKCQHRCSTSGYCKRFVRESCTAPINAYVCVSM